MFRNILVPLDGSTFAEQALPFAISIARRAGAIVRIVLAHVPIPALGGGAQLVFDLDQIRRQEEAAYLDDVVKRLGGKIEPVPVSRSLVTGLAVAALHEHALTVGADLVVMATHGRGPFSRFWLGSVADSLMRQLPMPVLLVRPQEEAQDLAQDRAFTHILIPLDGSELAEQILEPAIALGTLMDADYLLLRVVDPMTSSGVDAAGFQSTDFAEEGRKRLQEEAGQYLDRVAGQLREQALRVHTRVLVSCQAAEAILKEAGTHPSDPIALATHGRGGIVRLALGSVADKVVRGTLAPVLVHRPAHSAAHG